MLTRSIFHGLRTLSTLLMILLYSCPGAARLTYLVCQRLCCHSLLLRTFVVGTCNNRAEALLILSRGNKRADHRVLNTDIAIDEPCLWWLVVILVVNSAIGLFYYLRIIVAMYRETLREVPLPLPSSALSGNIALAALTLLLLWFGIYPVALIILQFPPYFPV